MDKPQLLAFPPILLAIAVRLRGEEKFLKKNLAGICTKPVSYGGVLPILLNSKLATPATTKSPKTHSINVINCKIAKTVNTSRRATAIMPTAIFLRRIFWGLKLFFARIYVTIYLNINGVKICLNVHP